MTDTAKHTPGPWEANKRGIGSHGQFDGYEIQTTATKEDFSKTVVEPAIMKNADARLIAAAPELLEALEAIAMTQEGKEDMRSIARAAIAKARGEVK